MGRLIGLSLWRGLPGEILQHELEDRAPVGFVGGDRAEDRQPQHRDGKEREQRVVRDGGRVREVVAPAEALLDFIVAQLDALRSRTVTFGIAGTLALVWGSLGVCGAISTAVNHAWRVEQPRGFWTHNVVSLLMLLVAGAILLAALLLVSASHMVRATWFAGVLMSFPGLGVLPSLAVRYATTGLFVLVVGLVYYFVPNAKVRFRDVWIGALLTGVLWTLALEGFSWYMRDMTRLSRVNGSIAAVVVFLVWVYVQAVILLYGVEFTAAYARLRTRR